MNASRSAICLSLFLGSCMMPGFAQQQADFGTIEGQVRYFGKVPPPKRILTTDGGSILHSDLIVDPKTKGLRHVVVVLENAPGKGISHCRIPGVVPSTIKFLWHQLT